MSVVPPNSPIPAVPAAGDVNDTPSPLALSIGSVVFRDVEHPQELPIKNIETMAVHKLPGGGRLIQTLGLQPESISFSGTLWNNTAKPRLDALRAMQSLASPVDLVFGEEIYLVVIKSVEGKYLNQWRIEYTIEAEVLSNKAGKFMGGMTMSAPSVDSQVSGLYAQSQATAGSLAQIDPASSKLQPGLNGLGTQLSIMGPIAQAIPSDISAALTAATTAIGQAQSYQLAVQGALNAATGLLSPNAQQQLFLASQLLVNLQNIASLVSEGQSPKIVQVSGPITLFELAAQYYQDFTQATQIQSANGIIGMAIPAGVTISVKLPSKSPTQSVVSPNVF